MSPTSPVPQSKDSPALATPSPSPNAPGPTLETAGAGANGAAKKDGAKLWLIDNTRAIDGALVVQSIGAPSLGTSPRGPALCFDGDDGILLAKHPLEGLTAFTLEVYVRIDGVTNPALASPRFVHIESDAGSRAMVEARVTETDFHLDTFLLHGTSKLTLIDSNKVHPVGRWTWVALSYANGQMRHFVDGVEDASGAVTIPPLGAGKMSLGVRQNLVHYFSGCIRELRVTPSALPPAQLQRTAH